METLWRDGRQPFHAETIRPPEDLTVADAVEAISSALDHIGSYYPGSRLHVFDDWHEHDGLLVGGKVRMIEFLRKEVSSPESYVASHSDDFLVYRSVYPDTLDFLLRYSLCEADGEGEVPAARGAHWTFTGYGFDLYEMKKRWERYGVVSEPSADYFKRRYGG